MADSGIATALQGAAANTTGAAPGKCKNCVKQGLAILPVIPSAVPNALRDKNAGLANLSRSYDAKDLKQNWFFLRALTAGYVYVLKPDKSWDAWLVDRSGLLRKLPAASIPADASAQAPLNIACHSAEHSNIATQVITLDPSLKEVWMAFSHYRWTGKVMRNYAANKGGIRDARLTHLDVAAAGKGELGKGQTVPFGARMRATVGQVVADYASADTRNALNASLDTPLYARTADAVPLAASMAAMSQQTPAKAGAIIVLRDDLGITWALNANRNRETQKFVAYMAQHGREQMVGDIILGFEEAFKEKGQSSQWQSRFYKHYDHAKVASDKQARVAETKRYDDLINAMSEDVAVYNGSNELKIVWNDFDPDDDQSARDRQNALAPCVLGAVKTKSEQAIWDKWFDEDPSDPNSTLWGAVTALNAKFGEFLLGKGLPDTGRASNALTAVKNMRKLILEFQKMVAARKAPEAMSVIGTGMTSQILRIQRLDPDRFKVSGWRVLAVTSTRTEITFTPYTTELTVSQQTVMMAEAAFGPPTGAAKVLLDQEENSGRRTFIVGSNGVDMYASNTYTNDRARVVEIWIPESEAATMAGSGSVGAGARLTLPAPKVNPYKALAQYTRQLPGVFAWVGVLLTGFSLANAAKKFEDDKVTDKSDAWFGVVSGSIALVGLMAEISSGAMLKMGPRFAATSVARLGFFGGVFSAVAGYAGSVQNFYKAVQRAKADDDDAAVAYSATAVFMIVSGTAGLLSVLGVASEAGVLTGSLSVLAPLGIAMAEVPVVGWIAIGLIALGLIVWASWEAISRTDTPMEVWLGSCYYGLGSKKYADAKTELAELNKVVYSMTIEARWSHRMGEKLSESWTELKNLFSSDAPPTAPDNYDEFSFLMTLPGASARSVIDCKVTLVGGSQRKQVYSETLRPQVMANNVLVDPRGTDQIFGLPPVQQDWMWKWMPRIGPSQTYGLSYAGSLLVNSSMFNAVEVEVSYWPDSQTLPSFVLPSGDKRVITANDSWF